MGYPRLGGPREMEDPGLEDLGRQGRLGGPKGMEDPRIGGPEDRGLQTRGSREMRDPRLENPGRRGPQNRRAQGDGKLQTRGGPEEVKDPRQGSREMGVLWARKTWGHRD